MPTVKKNRGIDPLPRYIKPETSVPEYDEILVQLQEYHRSLIGSSYYYIREENDIIFLCRLMPGAGKRFFHEIVDPEKYGISQDDLEEAINLDAGSLSTPGYYQISSHIDMKLRVMLDSP